MSIAINVGGGDSYTTESIRIHLDMGAHPFVWELLHDSAFYVPLYLRADAGKHMVQVHSYIRRYAHRDYMGELIEAEIRLTGTFAIIPTLLFTNSKLD